MLRAGEKRAGREHDDVLLALVLEYARGRVDAASVGKSQSNLPLSLSSAVNRPSLRPTNTSPPAVTIEPL